MIRFEDSQTGSIEAALLAGMRLNRLMDSSKIFCLFSFAGRARKRFFLVIGTFVL